MKKEKNEVKSNHSIYVYTNLINGHKYIGQTNDIARRKREHNCDFYNKNRKNYDSILARAVRKYGEENFSFKILAENLNQKDANLLEDYFIQEFNTKVPNGYNIKDGGQNASTSHLTKKEIKGIKIALKNGKAYWEIEREFDVAQGYISMINHGKYFYDENETYPLMKKQHTKFDEPVQYAVYLLKNSKLTLEQIGKEVGMCKASIVKINNGTYHHGASDTYPVRKTKAQRNKEAAELLATSDATIQEIAHFVGLSENTVRNINNGTYRKYEQYTYPIR